MPNSYFQFKQFIIHQDHCAMKVTTDACLFGAWVASQCRMAFPDRNEQDREGKEIPGKTSRSPESGRALDIGTGTGLLALMIAQGWKGNIDAIEIDGDAYTQAAENFAASPWANRLRPFHDDATRFGSKKNYELIVSNPPFYENELAPKDRRKKLAMHEGLTMEDLINIIQKNIIPEGSFFLLLPFKRHEEIKKLFSRNEIRILQLCFVRQSVKHDYFRVMLMGKLKQDALGMTGIDEIAIMDEEDQYTPEFKTLLKDYYLNL